MAATNNKPEPPIPGRSLALVAFARYSKRIRSYISWRLSNPQDVDDVVQAVYLKLASIQDDKLEVVNLFGFILTIVNRELAAFGASRAREREHMVSASPIDLHDTAVNTSNGGDPEEVLAIRQQIDIALKQLSPTLAAVLTLVVRDGWTYAEVAERMDISEHAVKKNLQRARKRLKRQLPTEKGR